MLTINKIQLTNFLSHSDTTLEMSQNQQILLDGNSGSGKSSIVDALVWGLYGRGRSDNRSLIKNGKKSASVTVTLSYQNDTIYSIKRSVNNMGKHELLVTRKILGKPFLPVPANGIKALQEYIEKQILHSSYLLFINSIIYPQDNINNFVKQTAARRKEIILEIVKASDYDEYYKKAKEKLDEMEVNSRVDIIGMKTEKNKLEELREKAVDINELQKELSEKEEEQKKNDFRLDIAMTLKKDYESDRDNLFSYNNEMTELREKHSIVINNKESFEKKNVKFSDLDVAKIEKSIINNKTKLEKYRLQEERKALWTEEMFILLKESPVDKDYEEISRRINKNIIDLMSKSVEKCPEIDKECPIITTERNIRVDELSKALDDNEKEKRVYIIEKTKYENAINKLGDQPPSKKKEILELEERIRKEESELSTTKEGNSELLLNIELCGKDLESINSKIKELESTISYLKKKISLFIDIDGEVKKLKSERTEINEAILKLSIEISSAIVVDLNIKKN